MDAGSICVARTLPIDAALVGDVLIRLVRDTTGAAARWTLGESGSAEVDVDFFPVLTAARADGPAWSTSARLWDPDGVAVAPAVVELSATSPDTCELMVRPSVPLPPWWSDRLPALLDLAHSTLDELGEELLWHATRDGVVSGGLR